MDNIKYWLWLSMVFGAESMAMWKTVNAYGGASEAYYGLVSGETDIKLTEKQIGNTEKYSLEQAESLIDYCQDRKINLICFDSHEYPDSLRHIVNPPAVLYYKGNIACISGERNIACVGTRNPSQYTVSIVSEICRELAGYGFTMISGFAVGVDIASHLAAVSENRPTVCVLGCGLDVNYPAENFKFRDSIIKSGGVFISEYPPGTPAYVANFPKRNRILSALGKATIVFEAAEKSGSINTASISVEQGKELFCIPPSDIKDKRYAGNINLLKSTATPLYSCDEILDFFNTERIDKKVFSESVNKSTVRKRSPLPTKKASSVKNKPTEKHEKYRTERENEKYKSLTPVQRAIVDALKGGSLHADDIARKTDIGIVDLMAELTELEMDDVIVALPGKFFKIC